MEKQGQMPTPELFFQTITAYQQTAALKAAIELKVFTAIGRKQRSAAEIAADLNCAEKGVRVICDSLTALGFLHKQDGLYRLTDDSAAFLDQASPFYLGGNAEFLLSPELLEAFNLTAAAIRKGGTALPEGGTVAPEHPVWVQFARAMKPMMIFPAKHIAELMASRCGPQPRVLDIAAGHGMFGIEIAKTIPAARVVAVDWPAVLEVAKQNARAEDVHQRYSTIAGSAFDVDFGSGYDLALLTNFLHHFDVPTCEKLIRKIKASLNPSGVVATLEFIPDAGRTSPPQAALFALVMLVSTASGDAYTFDELARMFRNAGFSKIEDHPIPAGIQHVLIASQ